MKKMLFILLAGCIAVSGLAAQDFEEVQAVFGEFANDLSSVLPFASTLGLNWSDSYIGNFPHLGVALSAGAVGLPAEAFGKVLGTLTGGAEGADLLDFLPPELAEFGETFGMPFPVAAIEARLGGLFLPFDIGLKLGMIPDQVDMGKILPAGMSAEYQLLGADVRFRLLKEKGIIPEISVGGGVNRLTGGVSFTSGENIDIASFEVPNFDDPINGAPTVYDIFLKEPKFGFDWETTVFDVKAQISKSILWIITPYLGIGMTMGESTVRGGAYTEVGGVAPEDWDDIAAALAMVGEEMPQLTADGFTISSSQSGYAVRVYGGTSLNLLFLKLDVTGFYELLSKAMGFSVGLRIQL